MVILESTQLNLEKELKKMEKKFTLTNEQLRKIIAVITSEMVKGLSCSGKNSSLGMLPTYVNALPNGKESGCFMALDLGGTNFRVLLVKIKASSNIEMISEQFLVPEDVKVGKCEDFFDHIAKCMFDFCQNNEVEGRHLPVGFTFSFPLKQHGINSATLLRWNKGFDVTDVEGSDVVKLLHEAIARRGDLNCEVVAIVNDTVGTMMACALDNRNCNVGLIVGTGLNACYMESVGNIGAVSCESATSSMCVNIELGGFGSNGVIDAFRNEYDREVDALTSNKQEQIFEKMVSGKYLGEIARVMLCDLTRKSHLFEGVGSKKLFQRNSFLTSYVSEIEGDSGDALKNVLNSLDLQPTVSDCETVRRVCHMVSQRAAHLSAAGVTAIAKKIKANHPEKNVMKVTVGVDGTMYRKHPRFSKYLSAKVDELCRSQGIVVDFELSNDGSGKGAAVIAAAMCNEAAT